MVDRIGREGLAKAAIEAALRRHAESVAAVPGGRTEETAAPRAPEFSTKLAEGLRAVDAEVKAAEALAEDVLTGRAVDFHEVAAQLKQSELSMRFALEVRNKFVDAYREIMRMSV